MRAIELLAATAAVVCASAAAGQDALGSGNALDAGLDTRSPVNAPVAQQRFRDRNLLITNDVLSGRGFRGSVGYTAADSFRGQAGSDDLYGFRSDAALSNVNFINFGNTYERFRFGQNLGILEYRRASAGTTMRSVKEGVRRPAQLVERQLIADQYTQASSLSSLSRQAVEPSTIGGYVNSAGNSVFLISSSLGGVQARPLGQMGQALGLSSFDHARIRQDVASGNEEALTELGLPFRRSYEDLQVASLRRQDEPLDARIESQAAQGVTSGHRVGEQVEPEFEQIRTRVAERFLRERGTALAEAGEGTEDEVATLEEEMEWLRQRLADSRAFAAAREPEETPARPHRERRLGPAGQLSRFGGEDPDEKERNRRPGARLRERAAAEAAAERDGRSVVEFGLILRHGERIDRLATDDPSRFNELLSSAEDHLRDGRYFWAERHFNRALRFTPGHPLATAGLAHAQIGAGLYRSAAIALRSLFIHQPEMIDARFDREIIPNDARLLRALETLQTRTRATRGLAETGFLYAYVGRLLGRPEVIAEGLLVMDKSDPGDEFTALLRAVWLDGSGVPATPPPTSPE